MVLVLEAHRGSEGRGGGGCQGVVASIAVRCRGSIGWLKYWPEQSGQRIPPVRELLLSLDALGDNSCTGG
jgi:hypothetical protein